MRPLSSRPGRPGAVQGRRGEREEDREMEGLKEREGEEQRKEGVAHGDGKGGGRGTLVTDRSADVAIRAQSEHINDQPVATLW